MLIRQILKNTLLTICALTLVAGTAVAQDVQKIAAIVNDDIISGYDLNQRIGLTIILSGFPDTARTRQQLAKSTLDRLIDDRLKMQEAERYNITVSDEDVFKALEYFEKQNNMKSGDLERILGAGNVEMATMLTQIRANLTWNRIIEARIIPRITISDEEVEAVQKRIEANKGKTEYLLSEIFLPVAANASEAQAHDAVANLVSQLRSGASFERAATQFSQGATAASGGSIGWVLAEEVEPEIAAVLSNLRDGQISDPIRTADGYFVVSVKGSRKILENNPDDITLDLAQFVIPNGPGAAAPEPETQKKLATTLSNFIDGCDDLPDLFTEIKGSGSGKLGKIRLGDLPDNIKSILKDMKTGDVSAPYQDGDMYRVFVVCDRNDPQEVSSSPDEIRRDIMIRRAENRARGYLQDIHNAATVETR